jgi:hypothetical protein
MMRVFFSLLFVLSYLPNASAQIKGQTFTYLSTYQDSSGLRIIDSLMIAFDTSAWKFQDKQNQLRFNFFSNSLNIEKFYKAHPLAAERIRFEKNCAKRDKGKKSWENYTVLDSVEVSGYIANDSIFLMHSPRSNQYAKCQVAPLVEVHLQQLSEGSEWDSKLIILKGYPNNEEFIGSLDCEYKVIGEKQYLYKNNTISCWEIRAVAKHIKLGMSTTTYLFNEQIGVLSIEYQFYDRSSVTLLLR